MDASTSKTTIVTPRRIPKTNGIYGLEKKCNILDTEAMQKDTTKIRLTSNRTIQVPMQNKTENDTAKSEQNL